MHCGVTGRRLMRGVPQWQAEVVVRAALADVWNAVDDISLIPEYHPEVRHVEFLSGQARRAKGVRYKCVVTEGRKGWCVEEVVAHQPFERTTVAFPEDSWGISRRLADFLTEISVAPTHNGETLLRLRAWYRPRGWLMRLANPLLMRRMMRKRAVRTLEGLKRLVERRGQPGPA